MVYKQLGSRTLTNPLNFSVPICKVRNSLSYPSSTTFAGMKHSDGLRREYSACKETHA